MKTIFHILSIFVMSCFIITSTASDSYSGKSGGFRSSSSSSRSTFSSSSKSSFSPSSTSKPSSVTASKPKSFGTDASTVLGRAISKQAVNDSVAKPSAVASTPVRSSMPTSTPSTVTAPPSTGSSASKSVAGTGTEANSVNAPPKSVQTPNYKPGTNLVVIPPVFGSGYAHSATMPKGGNESKADAVGNQTGDTGTKTKKESSGFSFWPIIFMLFACLCLAYGFILFKERKMLSAVLDRKAKEKMSKFARDNTSHEKEKIVPRFAELNKRDPKSYRVNGKIRIDDSVTLIADSYGHNKEIIPGEHMISKLDMDMRGNAPAMIAGLEKDMILYCIIKDGEVTETYLMKHSSEQHFANQDDVEEWIGEQGIIGDYSVTTPDNETFTRVVMPDIESRIQPYRYSGTDCKHQQMLYGRWISDDFAEFMLFDYFEEGNYAGVNVYNGIRVEPAMLEFMY